ncbi:MAG: hypothetical protein AAGE84_00405 [Cyanobacteria bacterium P01_G01_bin.39]
MMFIFEDDGSGRKLVRQAMLAQYNDKQGKPVGIQRQIGRKPILAVRNSTGDLQMFQYTDDGQGASSNSLIVLINHDDCKREYQYNEGESDDNLSFDTAQDRDNWIVVSMEEDFTTIFAKELTRDKNVEYCQRNES